MPWSRSNIFLAFVVATFVIMTWRTDQSMAAADGASSQPATTQPTERQRIDEAIRRIELSGLTFIRNGSEYTAKEGAEHLRSKLERAGNRVKTYDDFLEHVASKSSMSGKPYLVKLADGSTKTVKAWLADDAAARK